MDGGDRRGQALRPEEARLRPRQRPDISGGEELTYDLKVMKRATIVGEVTGGGGNPSDRFPVTDHFTIAIPVGRAVNPITKTSWEGTGVRPDVEVPAAQALSTAHLMALKAELAESQDRDAQNYLRDTMADVQADLDRSKGIASPLK